MTSLRDPRGNQTTYAYDQLNRRKTLTNPLSQAWTTAFENLVAGGTRTTMTYPNGGTQQVQREFDRLGRLKTIQYLNESPKNTRDVKFSYNVAGSRTAMSEYTSAGFTNRVRETQYSYDDVRRLTSVGFDNDGNGTVDQTVSYEYDAGGLRTKLTLPGNLNLTYTYDAKGRLVSLTDWDSQTTTFAHDNANRLLASTRANGLRCRYSYDAASRLRWMRHAKNNKTLAHIAYDVDRRGNRTRAQEAFVGSTTTSEAGVAYNDPGIAYKGGWSDNEPFMATTDPSASLQFAFMVNVDAPTQPQFTFGIGPDHGIVDVYVGGTLWQSLDGYAASTGERTVSLNVSEGGPIIFEIRNRREKNLASSGYKVRFKQLIVHDFSYSLFTHVYTYDTLSRIKYANRHFGFNTSISNASSYGYSYDLAGNRLSETLVIHDQYGFPTVIPNFSATYNAANQISSSGFTYDANGNLTSDGSNNTYTWDRANRLLHVDAPDGHIPGIDTAYTYDGLGNRIERNSTQYLLDLQPGLSVVLASTQGASTTRYVHGPTGIHAHKDNAGNWEWLIQDGLGSVRSVVDDNLEVLDSRWYEPYGATLATAGSPQTIYGFTGEPTDSNGLVHLRARYYAPNLGVFPSLDPLEGTMQRPMSLNGYSWVEGNIVNLKDASGTQSDTPCEPFSELSINTRRFSCKLVRDYFAQSRIPTFDALGACYYCMMDYSADTGLSREQYLRAYWQGLQGAVRDGFIIIDEARMILARVQEMTPEDPAPYQANLSDLVRSIFDTSSQLIGGYIEGASGSATISGNNAQVGLEVVYNFSTFQRMLWRYGGTGGYTALVGASAALYVGHVEGFRPSSSQGHPQDNANFDQFREQYRGEFIFSTVGVNVGRTGGFVVHFHSPDGSIYGNSLVVSSGASLEPPVSGGLGRLWYSEIPKSGKSYILPNCRVDVAEMAGDILSGQDSPLMLFAPSAVPALAFRVAAVASLRGAVRQYETTHADQCSC